MPCPDPVMGSAVAPAPHMPFGALPPGSTQAVQTPCASSPASRSAGPRLHRFTSRAYDRRR
jgi:hypothetical protein